MSMNKTFFLAEEMYADGDYKSALELFQSIKEKDDDVLNYIGIPTNNIISIEYPKILNNDNM